jgi:Tol biopolymer transport system component
MRAVHVSQAAKTLKKEECLMQSVARISVSLVPLAFLLACNPDSSTTVPGIQAMSFANSEWSEPVNLGAPVNSSANDMNATLSPDELSLYFVSTRTGGFGNADIWVSRRASLDSPWETPVNLGPSLNGPGIEASPTLSIDGHILFFSSDRPGGQGSNDIYVAHRVDKSDDLGWEPPINLGADVNTPAFEAGGAYLQSAEEGRANFYFVRGPNTVALDIYVTSINRDGEPGGPAVIVAELNDVNPAVTDAHPSVRVDGRELFFYSNRAGSLGASDLWRSTRRDVHESWSTPENVGAPLSNVANDIQPTLSFDGRTLIFASARSGGFGGSDIWMSTRTPSGQ